MPDPHPSDQMAARRAVISRLSVALGLTVLAFGLWVRWWGAPWAGVDLRVYLAGARSVLEGRDLYALTVGDGHGGVLRFSYPPFAALAFVPLVWTGAAAAATLGVASLGAYGAMAAICARVVGWRARGAGVVFLVGLALEPVQRTLLYGQINLILAGLVLADIFVVRPGGRGWLSGVAAGLKLTPAVFVLYFLVRREWASAARMGLGFAATVALGWVALPGDSARFWLHSLGSMSQFGGDVVLWGDQSLGAVVQRASQLHGVPTTTVHLVTWALCGAVGLLMLAAAWLQSAAGDRLAMVVVLGLGGLLISPVSWTHHWVWVVPAVALMWWRRWHVLAAMTVVGFFLPPMWALHARPDSELGYTPLELILSAAFVLWALLVLTVLLIDGLRTRRRRDLSPGRAPDLWPHGTVGAASAGPAAPLVNEHV